MDAYNLHLNKHAYYTYSKEIVGLWLYIKHTSPVKKCCQLLTAEAEMAIILMIDLISLLELKRNFITLLKAMLNNKVKNMT